MNKSINFAAKTMGILIAAALAFGCMPASAMAVTTIKQSGNAIEPFSPSEMGVFNNKNALIASKVKTYARSKGMKPSYPFEKKANTIKVSKSAGSAMTSNFKTYWFLPVTYKKSGDWAGPQSIVVSQDSKYIYVLLTKGEGKNKGRIIRYDYSELSKLKLSKAGKNLAKLRWATFNKLKKKATKAEKKILKYIKVGPEFNVGHGQSLALNPATNELWMWKDEQTKNKKWKAPYKAILQRINTTTLKPNLLVQFKMTAGNGAGVAAGHNLTFDSDGTGYYAMSMSSGSYYRIFSFTMSESHKVTVTLRKQIKHVASKGSIQGMAFNPKSGLLNIISDGAVMAFAPQSLDNLKSSDISYALFNSKREFEGIAYDQDGYAYLLLNRGPEILRSTKALLPVDTATQ